MSLPTLLRLRRTIPILVHFLFSILWAACREETELKAEATELEVPLATRLGSRRPRVSRTRAVSQPYVPYRAITNSATKGRWSDPKDGSTRIEQMRKCRVQNT
jgi:hypothetical protein